MRYLTTRRSSGAGGRAALAGPPLERLRRAAFGQRPATAVRHSSSGRSKTSNLQNQPSVSPGPSGVREWRRAPPPNRQAASTAVWRGSTQMVGRENKQGVGFGRREAVLCAAHAPKLDAVAGTAVHIGNRGTEGSWSTSAAGRCRKKIKPVPQPPVMEELVQGKMETWESSGRQGRGREHNKRG